MQQAGFLIDFEHGAVGSEACLQTHGDARCKLAAKIGGAVEDYLRAILASEGADPVSEDARVVCGQAVVLAAQHLVGAVGDQSIRCSIVGIRGFP